METAEWHPVTTVSLLAERPLVPTIDGSAATPSPRSRAVDGPVEAAGALGHSSPGVTARGGVIGAGPVLQRSVAPTSSTRQDAPIRGRAWPSIPHPSAPSLPTAAPDFGGFVPDEAGTLWALDDAAPTGSGPVAVQREEEPSSAAAPQAGPAPPVTTTAVATVGPAAPTTAAAGTPKSEAELQELCRALYPPLRRRLCRDLLVDRERAGYRTDIRF
jgi:hypothetical protein